MPTGEALAGVATVPLGTGGGGGSVPHDAMVGLSWNVAGHEREWALVAQFHEEQRCSWGRAYIPPVPGRLAERIRNWEFIEMFELLQELLANQKAGESTEKQPHRARGHKRVQDIGAWLQCFAVFVGLVAKSSPEAVPRLMAYMISIIRASQEYEGVAWAAYEFRRQAAATGQRDWAKINSSLYTICFT